MINSSVSWWSISVFNSSTSTKQHPLCLLRHTIHSQLTTLPQLTMDWCQHDYISIISLQSHWQKRTAVVASAQRKPKCSFTPNFPKQLWFGPSPQPAFPFSLFDNVVILYLFLLRTKKTKTNVSYLSHKSVIWSDTVIPTVCCDRQNVA